VQAVPTVKSSRWSALLTKLTKPFGAEVIHLQVAAQTCVSFIILMSFIAITPIYNALWGRISERAVAGGAGRGHPFGLMIAVELLDAVNARAID
jgi:hypothetical protein